MTVQHFGLERPLLADGIARDAAFFADDRERATLAHAGLALRSRDAVLVLMGPAGVGKTTLATATVGAASDSSRVVSAWLNGPALAPYEILDLLLLDFGFDPYSQTRVERLQTWRQFLIEMVSTDTRIFVAVERADELDGHVLKALAALTAADPNGCPGANLLLMGRESLAAKLREPELEALSQRVRLQRRLAPFDAATLEAYVRHAVQRAGGKFDTIFARGALEALLTFSGGIPRVVNQLLDMALGLAAEHGSSQVTGAVVREAAIDVCGFAEPAGDDESGAPRRSSRGRAPEDIPVLTESVDVDFEAVGAHVPAASRPPRATPAVSRPQAAASATRVPTSATGTRKPTEPGAAPGHASRAPLSAAAAAQASRPAQSAGAATRAALRSPLPTAPSAGPATLAAPTFSSSTGPTLTPPSVAIVAPGPGAARPAVSVAALLIEPGGDFAQSTSAKQVEGRTPEASAAQGSSGPAAAASAEATFEALSAELVDSLLADDGTGDPPRAHDAAPETESDEPASEASKPEAEAPHAKLLRASA